MGCSKAASTSADAEKQQKDAVAPDEAPATAMSKSRMKKLKRKATEAAKKAAAAGNKSQQASSSFSISHSQVPDLIIICRKQECFSRGAQGIKFSRVTFQIYVALQLEIWHRRFQCASQQQRTYHTCNVLEIVCLKGISLSHTAMH